MGTNKAAETKRWSVKCALCGARFMSELSGTLTAERHAETCERFRIRLAARIEYRTRMGTRIGETKQTTELIYAAELYQMYALHLDRSDVKGRFNEAVPCDARCFNARGHNCECQCGGHNHGAGNAMACGMAA